MSEIHERYFLKVNMWLPMFRLVCRYEQKGGGAENSIYENHRVRFIAGHAGMVAPLIKSQTVLKP